MGCHHHFEITAVPNQLETNMSERQDTLKKARDRMIEDRDAHAKVLAAPYDRDKAERARIKFVEIQGVIDAIDRAIVSSE
jgi:acid stress-induced BolA-like protein IbaG/YrbA